MIALALLLLALGALLINAAVTGKSLRDLVRGATKIDAGSEPQLGGL